MIIVWLFWLDDNAGFTVIMVWMFCMQIYRKTHGEHVGFKMFMDELLLSMTRKVKLQFVFYYIHYFIVAI